MYKRQVLYYTLYKSNKKTIVISQNIIAKAVEKYRKDVYKRQAQTVC